MKKEWENWFRNEEKEYSTKGYLLNHHGKQFKILFLIIYSEGSASSSNNGATVYNWQDFFI